MGWRKSNSSVPAGPVPAEPVPAERKLDRPSAVSSAELEAIQSKLKEKEDEKSRASLTRKNHADIANQLAAELGNDEPLKQHKKTFYKDASRTGLFDSKARITGDYVKKGEANSINQMLKRKKFAAEAAKEVKSGSIFSRPARSLHRLLRYRRAKQLQQAEPSLNEQSAIAAVSFADKLAASRKSAKERNSAGGTRNSATGERNSAAETPTQSSVKKSPVTLPPSSTLPPPLPTGWKEATAPDGRTYYWCHSADGGKATQWVRPTQPVDQPLQPGEATSQLTEKQLEC